MQRSRCIFSPAPHIHYLSIAERLYKEGCLQRLFDRRLWPVAEAYVLEPANAGFQSFLFSLMAAAPEDDTAAAQLRARLAQRLGEEGAGEGPRGGGDAKPPPSANYLRLPEGFEIVVVTTVDGLELARTALLEAEAVGVDCEWKAWCALLSFSAPYCARFLVHITHVAPHTSSPSPPSLLLFSFQRRQPTTAALLQLSTAQQAFLFDLPALAARPRSDDDGGAGSGVPALEIFDELLGQVLGSPRPIKLGYGLSSDLKRLAAAYPTLRAPRAGMRQQLDLAKWQAAAQPTDSSGSPARGLSGAHSRLI